MKKHFSSFNKFFKKYQPTIGVIAIVAILITLGIDINQNRLIQKQMSFDNDERMLKETPLFRVDFELNSSNRLNDRIIFSNGNPNQILQNISLYTLNKVELVNFKIHNKKFTTNKLKKIIIDISENIYPQYVEGYLNFQVNSNITETISYPIIIKFNYLENEELKSKSYLYEYKFQIYFFNEIRKIKSEGIEFIKLLNDSSENFKNILLDYSINISKPLGSKMYQNNLKNLLIEKDTIYSLVKKLIDIDVITDKNVIKYESCDCDSIIANLYFYIPSFYNDKYLLEKRDSLLIKIFDNKKKFNSKILNKVLHIQDSINMFTHRKSIIDKNELTSDSIELFQSQFDYWIKIHQELYVETLDGFMLE